MIRSIKHANRRYEILTERNVLDLVHIAKRQWNLKI